MGKEAGLDSREDSPNRLSGAAWQKQAQLLASTERLLAELKVPPSEFALGRTAWLEQVQPWLQTSLPEALRHEASHSSSPATSPAQYPDLELLQGHDVSHTERLLGSPNSGTSTIGPKHSTTHVTTSKQKQRMEQPVQVCFVTDFVANLPWKVELLLTSTGFAWSALKQCSETTHHDCTSSINRYFGSCGKMKL